MFLELGWGEDSRMKAILVIDVDDDITKYYADIFKDGVKYDEMVGRFYRFKPMPEKVKENVMKGMPNEDWQLLYDEGWNDCIKEIEK